MPLCDDSGEALEDGDSCPKCGEKIVRVANGDTGNMGELKHECP